MGRSLKKSRKRMIRYGLVTANVVLLFAVVGFVLKSPNTSQAIKQSALASDVVTASPLDQLSSSDIAVHLARMASLPESTAVVNQADTISGQLAISSADSRVVAKPQIVSTATKSYKDIKVYVVKSGDSIASVASRFGITSDSLRWSNNLDGNDLTPGRELYIPPVNGIVYLVKAGDTVEKLAREYNASRSAIEAFNDAEVFGLTVGRRIVIPDGTKATTTFNVASFGGGSAAWGGSAIYGYNGYDYGWCTWYAANKVAVPANWGNANTWDNYAPSSGWTVSTVPVAGAVAQTDAGGWGHVGVVEAVRQGPSGLEIKYSDMNGLAGWGATGYSGWVPANAKFQKFIYR